MESPTVVTLRSIIEDSAAKESPPYYFKVFFSNATKRIYNSTRGKTDKLSLGQNTLKFLALNDKQLEDSMKNMFPGHTLTFFQDEKSCKDKGFSGMTTRGLIEAYANWGEQGGRLQAVGFEVVTEEGNRVLHLHVRVHTTLLQGETIGGGSSSIDTLENTISESLRRVYRRVSGLWPRERSGMPMPWSDTPSWIKVMNVSAYKTELERQKIALKETAESSLKKYVDLPICFVLF